MASKKGEYTGKLKEDGVRVAGEFLENVSFACCCFRLGVG